MAIKLTEFTSLLLIALVGLFIIFQIIVPLFAGTPFFPILRRKPHEAISDLAEAQEAKAVHDIEAAAAAIRPKPEQPVQSTQKRGAK